jgi:hypothetical protein
MNKYEKLMVILPAVADAGPLLYYGPMVEWRRSAPYAIAITCSLAPLVVGISLLIALPILRRRGTIPRRSDGALIGVVLATAGLVVPFFFY